MKRLLTVLISALVLLTGVVTAPPASAATAQWRSFWVDTLNPGIFNAQQVKQVVADAKAANANVLIVQVVRRFECFCNKSDFPRATDSGLAAAPYDPLAEVIKQGHAAGLEVHAWVNVNRIWSSSEAPEAANHVFNTHGPSATGANRWLNKRADGGEFDGSASFLDLANPAAQDGIASLIGSIVENYDVDGINLDYIRYPDSAGTSGNQWGYSDTSLRRYRAATGNTSRPAPTDAAFGAFRRDQVTATVTKIKRAVDRMAPSTVLSVNGIAYGYGPGPGRSWESTDPYASVFQDWRKWAREGLVDAVTLMNYKNEANSSHAAMFKSWNEFLAQVQGETGRVMVSGPALYMNTPANSVRQASAVTALGLGWSGYSYATASTAANGASQTVRTAERKKVVDALAAGPFREWAAVPLMAWKPDAARDLYVIPGHHLVNGREWRTDCEAYSQTRRCTTEIKATTVTFDGTNYVKRYEWVFNNLTYLPLMTRAKWGTNPLANHGEFTSSGRPWRTECDTAATGRGGCRSYVMTYGMVHSEQNADGTWRYYRDDAWVFNNMVRFLDV